MDNDNKNLTPETTDSRSSSSHSGDHHGSHGSSSHSSHHSGSHGSHGHHSSKRRRSKRRLSKKNKNILIVNIIIGALALALLGVFVVFEISRQPGEGGGGEGSSGISDGMLRIEVPAFEEEVSLVGEAAKLVVSRDLSTSVTEAVKPYVAEGERLDFGGSVRLSYDITGYSVDRTVAGAVLEVSQKDGGGSSRAFNLAAHEKSVDVAFLKTGTEYTYLFTVKMTDGTESYAGGSFITADTPRILSIDGAVNVRDIGGWKTADGREIRQGLLIRGSELDGAVRGEYKITADGVNNMLALLGIKTDMDLRSPTVNSLPTDALGANVLHTYYDAPQYVDVFTDEGKASIGAIFADLADESRYPIYLHCTHGSDRTGTVCYILEALLGLSDDDLRREYELSMLFYYDVGDEVFDAFNAFETAFKNLDGATLAAKAEGYLLSCGLGADQIASLRSIFLG